MNRVFRKDRTGEVVDPVTYALDIQAQYSKKWHDLRIYIGSDSQNKRHGTQYVCVIAFRWPGDRGAHYIYSKENVEKIRDINEKLRQEVHLSMEVATYLHEKGVKIHCIDFDFNEDDMKRSNELVKYATGWASGMGFNSTCKPSEQVASRAADHLVKGEKGTRRKKFSRAKDRRKKLSQ